MSDIFMESYGCTSTSRCLPRSSCSAAVFSIDWTAEDSVSITSSCSALADFFEEKIASKASWFEDGGTVVETEMGRWIEKNDATCTSMRSLAGFSLSLFLLHRKSLTMRLLILRRRHTWQLRKRRIVLLLLSRPLLLPCPPTPPPLPLTLPSTTIHALRRRLPRRRTRRIKPITRFRRRR